MKKKKDHGASLLRVDPSAQATTEALPISDRIRQYLAWCESPEFKPCPRCNGKGYHHGFGEQGADPDWCLDCGGPGEEPTEPGTWSPEDLLREALDALVGSATDSQQEHAPSTRRSAAQK